MAVESGPGKVSPEQVDRGRVRVLLGRLYAVSFRMRSGEAIHSILGPRDPLGDELGSIAVELKPILDEWVGLRNNHHDTNLTP